MKTEQVLVKLPSKLLHKIDEIVDEGGYTSRQEFIREVIREKIRAAPRVELIAEEVRRRKMTVTPPPPRSSLQRGVRREVRLSEE